MTVAELQEKLVGLDPKTHIVVNHETDGEMELYVIGDVSLSKGHPRRDDGTGKTGFKFDKNGPATWLFISIEEA
jgi:hypothetical protein